MGDAALAMPSFAATLTAWQQHTEQALAHYLPAAEASPARLHQAMRYAVLGGGKRIRPALVYATAAAVDLSLDAVTPAACAVECIHAYSLIHDDLPAMDDDDLRRGKPTCHKAFDEATAILAGDALQTLAFDILSADSSNADAAVRLKLVSLLARASGTFGMAGGQALDLEAEGRSLDLAGITEVHARKTGALIHASVMMAAACQPTLGAADTAALDRYARDLGLAFQIQDDLLDIEGDAALLGKATGADQALRKSTYPGIVGTAHAHAQVQALHGSALAAVARFGGRAGTLEALADWLVRRRF